MAKFKIVVRDGNAVSPRIVEGKQLSYHEDKVIVYDQHDEIVFLAPTAAVISAERMAG